MLQINLNHWLARELAGEIDTLQPRNAMRKTAVTSVDLKLSDPSRSPFPG
eukprot:m.46643 g.46643  ORF g.46643 m.46643 type:complete len:50 (+) comp8785_c0_seq1:1524-1673(+)